MARRIVEIEDYGIVTLRSVVLESEDNTTLFEGIEIKTEDFGLIEIYRWYDIDELSLLEIKNFILEHKYKIK